MLDAPYDLNGKEPVADWYTRGVGYCPRDNVYYIWHESVEPDEQGYNNVLRQQAEEKGYKLFGTVLVNGQPRLRIYKMSQTPLKPKVFNSDAYEQRFDQTLSGPLFERNGPTADPAIQHPLDLRFGDAIHLRGYRLDQTHAVAKGGVELTLYWQATQPLDKGYSVFTQIIDMQDFHKAGQRDGEPGCNEYPTNFWRPGDVMVDRYYIPIFPDAKAGDYTLLIGMYDGHTGDRLPVTASDGQSLGDAYGLTGVTVRPAP